MGALVWIEAQSSNGGNDLTLAIAMGALRRFGASKALTRPPEAASLLTARLMCPPLAVEEREE